LGGYTAGVQVPGTIAVALIALVAVFQLALAGGAPWGRAAWGGQNAGILPPRLRMASLVAAVGLGFIAWLVLSTSGLVDPSPLPSAWIGPAMWVVTGYFALGAVVNLISRSPVERIWAPVSLATAICCAVVAMR
jgi:hypothetical protein